MSEISNLTLPEIMTISTLGLTAGTLSLTFMTFHLDEDLKQDVAESLLVIGAMTSLFLLFSSLLSLYYFFNHFIRIIHYSISLILFSIGLLIYPTIRIIFLKAFNTNNRMDTR